MNLARTVEETNYDTDKNYLKNNLTNPREVRDLIKNLSKNKAPGLYKITNEALKQLGRKSVCQLHYIINSTIKLQHFPTPWKGALVIPLPKQGKPTNVPGNLRPTSLLSSVGKLAEKVINNRLTRYDTKFKITQDEQFGFRQGHDTTQQITRIVTDITNNFNKDNITQLTLLDIRKAFDRVSIQGLISPNS
ncbi:hypothetical protein Zmor_000639 [Zophobas morio]|uniref:Reverse transcriptase domain-containing protein n=1 Tax=Zophobas morio TaxID=2755281 RepID=A0AA38J371_9CUCU|nr:hypothetical protein Zmor_000639 [Zophobas morio]